MSEMVSRRWTVDQDQQDERMRYVIRSGRQIVGRVSARSDAEMICRSNRELICQAARFSFYARKHRYEIEKLRHDIDDLCRSLARVIRAIKYSRFQEIKMATDEGRQLLTRVGSREPVR